MVVKMFFFGESNKKSLKCYNFFIKLLQVFIVPVVIPYLKDKDPKPVKSKYCYCKQFAVFMIDMCIQHLQ